MADKSLQALTTKIVQIADDTNKSIKPDVHAIRIAVEGGILASLMSIDKRLEKTEKQNKLSKLTGKNTVNNSRTIVKNTNSISVTLGKILDQVKRISVSGGSRFSRIKLDNYNDNRRKVKEFKNLSGALDIIERLRNVRLKDFIFSKLKIKNIRKVMSNFLSTFRMFKNQKEVNNTLNFANSSIELMKKLSKISIFSKPAQLGAKAIQKIFLGGKKDINGGIIDLFRKLSKNERYIKRGKKSAKRILESCGTMLLTSIILTGMAAVSIPAMLGALLMKGIVYLLVGTYRFLDKSKKHVIKGSLVMLIMSTSVISFALGLGLMVKAVKDMKLKDVGLMIASIAGIGLTVAGVGLLAAPIAIGSASLLLLGASLGVFGLVINAWRSLDVKPAMANIKEAVGGLRETFGLELGKGNEKKTVFQRLTGGVMDIAMGVLNFGSSFFVMGQLLLAGATLGLLYKGLKNWDNFNGVKAASNLKIGIGAVKDAFGLNDKNNKKEGIKGKLKKLGGKILDTGTSLLQGGKALAEMGIITTATGLADIIRVTLIPWRKFDAKPAAKNLKEAFASLKDAFGLNDKNHGTGVKKIGKLFGNALDMANTLIDGGGVLANMGTIMIATGLADIIKLNLKPWSNGDMNEPIKYLGEAIGSLKSIFGIEDNNDNVLLKPINTFGSIFDLATTLLQGSSTFVKMGTITLATGLAGKIKEYIMPWENYTGSKKAISNIGDTINGLLKLFDIGEINNDENKGFWKSVGDTLRNIGSAATSAIDSIASLAEGGSSLAKIGATASITKILASIQKDLSPWENFNSANAISNINKTLEGLSKISSIKIDANFNNPLKNTISTINALDIAKASTVVELFKSFSDIKDKPIDAFTKAVDKFSESCSDLIDSLNGFNGSNTTSSKGTQFVENSTKGDVNIINKDELATAIANAIKSLPVNVRTDISDVKLVVNNETGNRVVITLDN